MAKSSSPSPSESPNNGKSPNKALSRWRRTYSAVGFSKGYNFILFFIFAGAMMGFVLARLSYLNIGGSASSSFKNGSSPGEWYWYKTSHYRVGITLHLGAILPAGFLMVWQFVPIIRRKFILFHRINGYIIVLLVLIGNTGALMICRRSFGGTIETQVAVVTLVFLTTTSISLAYYNIKRLQIDQHRAWMLRAMFYLGTIITMRLIMIISAVITTQVSTYYSTMSCDEIYSLYESSALVNRLYPQCSNLNGTVDDMVVVKAKFKSQPEQIGASLGLSFGMALWLALVMHLAGVEIYLALTPREGNRLRQVSYERQLEQGFNHPGSAGLTSDRWGDAEEWNPATPVGKDKVTLRPKLQLSGSGDSEM